MKWRPPTKRQLHVLRVVHEFTDARGYPPTLREIMNAIGITSTNGVNDHLSALEKRGLITRASMTTRSIRVTAEGMKVLGVPPDGAVRWVASGDSAVTIDALRREVALLRSQVMNLEAELVDLQQFRSRALARADSARTVLADIGRRRA